MGRHYLSDADSECRAKRSEILGGPEKPLLHNELITDTTLVKAYPLCLSHATIYIL